MRPTRGAAPRRCMQPASPHEDHVGLVEVLGGVGGEEQVAAAGGKHHLLQPGLVDGQLVAVPGLDALCAEGSGSSVTGPSAWQRQQGFPLARPCQEARRMRGRGCGAVVGRAGPPPCACSSRNRAPSLMSRTTTSMLGHWRAMTAIDGLRGAEARRGGATTFELVHPGPPGLPASAASCIAHTRFHALGFPAPRRPHGPALPLRCCSVQIGSNSPPHPPPSPWETSLTRPHSQRRCRRSSSPCW
jgi:hypothetical protein